MKKRIQIVNDLRRRQPQKAPYETVLIVCEGEKTEVNYLKELRNHHRLNTANVIVVPSRGSAPISVVDFAIETAESMEGIDRVFCVLDRDEHPSFTTALDKIKNHKPGRKAKSKPKYQVIVSTPCFEIWPFLHFQYSTKGYSRSGECSACDNLVKELRQYLRDYTKNSDNLFMQLNANDGTQKAITNAKKLKQDNENTGSNNPSTDMHELVEFLLKLKN